jgi:hypothetical protein
VTTLADVLAKPEPRSIADVATLLQAVADALPAADGLAAFTKLYLAVTRAVDATSTFADPRFLERLDVVFAGLYFEALRKLLADPRSVPRAWAPLVEARSSPRIAPIQFAFAGMNAHINRDLPVALVTTCEELGVDLGAAGPQHADFVRVNALLAETEQRVKATFATGLVGVVDVALGELDDRIAMWDVGRARDAAWVQAQTLWTLRGFPPLLAGYLETLDRFVGFAGRGLLVPLPVP